MEHKQSKRYELPDFSKNEGCARVWLAFIVISFINFFGLEQPSLSISMAWTNFSVSCVFASLYIIILRFLWGRVGESLRWVFILSAPLIGAWAGIRLGREGAHMPWDIIKSSISIGICLMYEDWRREVESPALAVAQLQALQARIRPHFLFNSITAIVTMVKKNPTKAQEALLDLADIFRATMKESTSLVKIEEEFALAEKYLSIEKLRFGERLSIDTVFDSNAKNALLPHLILQPLVENAVIHGVERVSNGSISMRAFAAGNRLNIIVENSMPTSQGAKNPRVGNQMALDNIKQRLSLHYGDEAELNCGKKDGIWRARIVLPFHVENGEQKSARR